MGENHFLFLWGGARGIFERHKHTTLFVSAAYSYLLQRYEYAALDGVGRVLVTFSFESDATLLPTLYTSASLAVNGSQLSNQFNLFPNIISAIHKHEHNKYIYPNRDIAPGDDQVKVGYAETNRGQQQRHHDGPFCP
jgi:hypothetical protein